MVNDDEPPTFRAWRRRADRTAVPYVLLPPRPHAAAMDNAAILVILVLLGLLGAVIWMLRRTTNAAQQRERETQAALIQAQAHAMVGEEAKRSLGAAQTERSAALERAAADGAARAAAQAEAESLRTARDEASKLGAAERQRVAELSLRAQALDAARSAAVAELDALRESRKADAERIRALEQEVASVRADRDQAAAGLAGAKEQIAQLDGAQSALRSATAASDGAKAAQAAAEAAKATAEAETRAAQAQAADLAARLSATDASLAALRGEHLRANTEAQRLAGELTQAVALANERQKAQEDARGQMATQLRALTQQLYEEQGKIMMGEGRLAMEQTLAPLRERLHEFQARLDKAHETDVRERASLQSEIKNLLAAETRLSAEAEQLGRALRADTKSQGTWGELTLERLLEASQLERGLAYELQVSVRDDEGGAGRPDAVIFLPDQKALAVDAKVSLTAFMRAVNAGSEEARAAALVDHVRSVRTHMRTLADRNYPEALKGHSLDMVLLFLPSEAAFAAAVAQDGELWSDAWKNRVIIVSPTTLLATLRVVGQIWRVEKQNRNASAIAKEAGGILEKLRGFINDFAAVGDALQAAHRAFDTAHGKLATGKGNLVNRAQKLIRLGAPAKDETRAALASVGDDEEDAAAETDGPGALPPPGDPPRA